MLCSSAYKARDTERLGQTLDVEHSHVRFLGNLVLNLWDCGGQGSYLASYLDDRRQQVFGRVGVLIYVFDLVGEDNWQKDMQAYKECLAALQANSPQAHVFCLLHKMDLVEAPRRRSVYASRVEDLRKKSQGSNIDCFGTSIMDETIYQAWSKILQVLIPNVDALERQLNHFARLNSAEEVVIFEQTTFLVICKSHQQKALQDGMEEEEGGGGEEEEEEKKGQLYPGRFGKISQQVKELRGSCQKLQSTFQAIELRTGSGLTAYLDILTPNTYIMVISADQQVELSAIKLNVQLARESFEQSLSLSLNNSM